MIPVLHEAAAKTFTSLGIGMLTECLSCVVVEERNGVYSLELEYPVFGKYAEELRDGRIITAIPSPYRSPQPFRIYETSAELDGVITVYAHHVSYDLLGIPVLGFAAESVEEAVRQLGGRILVGCGFSFSTDSDSPGHYSKSEPSPVRDVLGGSEGSFLDVYGGEYEFDGMNVKLLKKRGRPSGVRIAYGKDLLALTYHTDSSNYATGAVGYWKDAETGKTIISDVRRLIGAYEREHILTFDLTDAFDAEPTVADVSAATLVRLKSSSSTTPDVSITVKRGYGKSAEKRLRELEECDLCDTVDIWYPYLGLDVTAEIVRVETDALKERYDGITVGSIHSTAASDLAGLTKRARTTGGSPAGTSSGVGIAAGTVHVETSIEQLSQTVNVAFDREMAGIPVVISTGSGGALRKTNVTTQGFDLTVTTATPEVVVVDWQAICKG